MKIQQLGKVNVVINFIVLMLGLVMSQTTLATVDNIDWQWANPSPQGNPFNAVAYWKTKSSIVAAGDQGNIISSADSGSNWTVRSSGTSEKLNALSQDDVNLGR